MAEGPVGAPADFNPHRLLQVLSVVDRPNIVHYVIFECTLKNRPPLYDHTVHQNIRDGPTTLPPLLHPRAHYNIVH